MGRAGVQAFLKRVKQHDLQLSDGRRLHVYDTRPDDSNARLVIVWHHGTPNLGEPPEPLLPAAAQRGIRWISYDRPGYGGSSRRDGRNLASAGTDVASIADALGVGRFAVMGHSGGGSHALACGALLSDRLVGVVSVSGLAPYDAVELDWFAGMGPPALGNCARLLGDAPRSRSTWRPRRSTRKCSRPQITPPSPESGHGWERSLGER